MAIGWRVSNKCRSAISLPIPSRVNSTPNRYTASTPALIRSLLPIQQGQAYHLAADTVRRCMDQRANRWWLWAAEDWYKLLTWPSPSLFRACRKLFHQSSVFGPCDRNWSGRWRWSVYGDLRVSAEVHSAKTPANACGTSRRIHQLTFVSCK